MQRLRIKPVGEGDYLICLDRDSAKAVHVAFNIIFKVPIGDRTQKWHSGIHCLNVRVSSQAYRSNGSKCDICPAMSSARNIGIETDIMMRSGRVAVRLCKARDETGADRVDDDRVLVACSNGARVAVPVAATRTSGAAATNSAACL